MQSGCSCVTDQPIHAPTCQLLWLLATLYLGLHTGPSFSAARGHRGGQEQFQFLGLIGLYDNSPDLTGIALT